MSVETIIYSDSTTEQDSMMRGDKNIPHNKKEMQQRALPHSIVPMVSFLETIAGRMPYVTEIIIPRIANPLLSNEQVQLNCTEKKGVRSFKLTVPDKRKGTLRQSPMGKPFKASTTPQEVLEISDILYSTTKEHNLKGLSGGKSFPYMSARLFEGIQKSNNPIIKKINLLLADFDYVPVYLGGKLTFPEEGKLFEPSINFQKNMLLTNGEPEELDPIINVKYDISDFKLDVVPSLAGYKGIIKVTASIDDEVNFQADLNIGFMPTSFLVNNLALKRFGSLGENTETYKNFKKKKNMLLFGGDGAVGSAVLEKAKEDYNVIILNRKKGFVPEGVNGSFLRTDVLNLDLLKNVEDHLNELKEQGLIDNTEIDALVYTPAYGDVGFPSSEATKEQIEKAKQVSLDPLKTLISKFKPKKTVAYSAQTQMFTGLFDVYGSMAGAKGGLETTSKILNEAGYDMGVIKAGHFESESFYGIVIEAMKNALKKGNEIDPMEALYQFRQQEQRIFGNTRITTPRDVAEVTMEYLRTDTYKNQPIVNRVGEKTFLESR